MSISPPVMWASSSLGSLPTELRGAARVFRMNRLRKVTSYGTIRRQSRLSNCRLVKLCLGTSRLVKPRSSGTNLPVVYSTPKARHTEHKPEIPEYADRLRNVESKVGRRSAIRHAVMAV